MKSRFFFAVLIFTLLITVQISAKDTWVNVRSKNFFLIGNASEKDIRGVATKLEQFRETFRLLFPKVSFTQSIQTNVVVFKNKSAYKPFLPKRADGKPDEAIAGYFQSGEDVNYITLSLDGEKRQTYQTIFHEYVHFMVNANFGRSVIPPWFNEGLAEYYSTFDVEDGQKALLGDTKPEHLYFLRQNKLLPLKTLFEIDNLSLQQNGNHSRSIFYAQAWALIHYLIQGNKGANNEAMNKFLELILKKVEPEKAFQQVFQTDYTAMEKALKQYVFDGKYMMSVVTFPKKLLFDAEITTVPLSEAETNAYLGDLLFHTHEETEAEVYLNKALMLDANSVVANNSLGLIKTKQRNFAEAKKYLETAINNDRKNHFTNYNFAYILSRESMNEFGYVSRYPTEAATKIRALLQKAIDLKPDFTESYRLLAFVNLVNNENLDESLALLKKGLTYQAGNDQSQLLIAQIYMRQAKFAESRTLAENLVKNSDESSIRTNAQKLLTSIKKNEEIKAENERRKKELEQQITQNGKNGEVVIVRNKREKPLTEEEWAKINEENENNEVNRGIERPKVGEAIVVGNIEKITCIKGVVIYEIKTAAKRLSLASKDFNELKMINFSNDNKNTQVGCGTELKQFLTVLTYRENKNPKITSDGSLIAIYFVPNNFKLKTAEEMANLKDVRIINEIETPPEEIAKEDADFQKKRDEAKLQEIRDALRQPQEGEKREMGILENIECNGKDVFFVVKIGTRLLKLEANSPQDIQIKVFTPDIQGLEFGCGSKFPVTPAVITYRTNEKSSQIVSIDFVPKSFKLVD